MKFNAILISIILQCWVSFAQTADNDNNYPEVQIYLVESKLFDLLYRQQMDFIKLYNERSLVDNESLDEKCFNILMYIRGGVPEKAIETLKEMKNKYPHLNYLSDLYFEIKNYSQPKVLNTLVSLYPIELEQYWLDYVKYLYTEEEWSFDKIINWLDSLPKTDKIFRFNNPKQYDNRLYIKKDYYKWMGKEKEFIIDMFDSIKNSDADGDKVLTYLDVINNTDFIGYGFVLKWISQYIKPNYSTDALFVAEILNRFNYYEEALHFYEIALNTELTDIEYTYLNWGLSNRVPHERLKQNHEYNIIVQTIDLMIKMGRNKEAHAMMMTNISLMDVGGKNYDFNYAGMLQGKTGIFKIEKEIIRGERENRKNPQYWMNRSYYYEGRENDDKADYAMIKGIKLLKKKYSQDTLCFIADYENFISRHYNLLGKLNNQQVAFEFCFNELKRVPLSSDLANSIVYFISDLYNKEYEINVWDNIYWDFLKENNNWGSDLISRLLIDCNINEKDSVFFRLKELAKNDPDKSYLLALNNQIQKYYPKEAINLLMFVRNIEVNIKRETNWDEFNAKHKLDRINQLLVELYIEITDFKSAESILYEIEDMSFIVKNIENLTILSAQQGKLQESFRLWSVVNNINPSNMLLLSKLSNYKMNEYFLNYYQNMFERLPESFIPAEAFRIINQKTE
jgi:hypothetical protein